MTYEISNSQNIIDSRDIVDRIKDIEDMLDLDDNADWQIEEYEQELETLKSLQSDWGDDESFEFGVTFIRASYFEDYAVEFAEDVGYLTDKTYQWPYSHIDWESASEELKTDYSEVDFDGVSYYGRE